MKSKNLIFLMAIVAGATVLCSVIQPTVVHQLVVWVGGLFSLVLIGLVFLVCNWPETAAKPERQRTVVNVNTAMPELSEASVRSVLHLRSLGLSDEQIASGSGFTPEQIKAIK